MQEERTEAKKERETKDDGRYIIFYTFEDDLEDEGEAPTSGRDAEETG